MQALIGETNRVLGLAVDHGLRDNLPPAEMISKLRNDVFVFSACKTHIQLKEVGSKLVDENGKINGYQKFSQEVSAIHKAYNENYLQAEYIFATSSAEMAAKWSRFEKDGDRYNLQYRTAQDNRVRDAHAKLAGTTLPVSDPFWDSYYPPNGWRCRCTAVQVLKEKYPESNSTDSIKTADKETTQIDSKGRDRNAMFRFNPGKQQVIFPPNNLYSKVMDVPQVKKAIKDLQPADPIDPQNSFTKSIEHAKNNKEIAGLLQKKLSDLGHSSVKVNMSGADLATAKLYAKELTDLCSKYNIEHKFGEFTTNQFKSWNGVVKTFNTNGKPRRFISESVGFKTMNTGQRIDGRRLHLHATEKSRCDSDKLQVSTLNHEFGHLMWTGDSALSSASKEFGTKLSAIRSQYHSELLDLNRKRQRDTPSWDNAYLGNYAQNNINEFLAEAFQEYRNFKNPGKYAKKVGELVDEYFKK